MTNVFPKDPNAVLDYQWDWSDWLATSETIVSAVITMPAGLTLDSQVNASTKVTAWFSGGTDGSGYRIVCHIVTNSVPARQDDRSIYLYGRER